MPSGPGHPQFTGPIAEFKRPDAFTTKPVITNVSPNAGRISGGESITLTGSHFSGVESVLFGSQPATSVVIVSDTSITLVAPAQTEAGLVDVSVVKGSETGTILNAYTYVEGVITKITPSHGPFGGGTQVQIEGYNFVTGSTITFGGEPATNVVFIDENHFSAVTPAHARGYVDVVITEPLTAEVTFRNGFQFTFLTRGDDIRRQPGISIRDVLSSEPNTCNMVIDGESNTPTIGEVIEIIDSADGNRLLFRGSVLTIDQNYEGQTDQLCWATRCVDFTWLFNRRRPVGHFSQVSVSDVVKSLVTSFAPGFTTNHVQTNLAKVSVSLDGSQDFISVMNDLAAAIGGGHWYIDYDMDVHFFHVVPASLEVPPSLMPTDTSHMTVAEGSNIPTTFSYEPGYYLFRHSFLYSDGTESVLKAVSNMLTATGFKQLSFTGIPTGANPGGGITCVGRRIYYNRWIAYTKEQSPIENIRGFIQINDNVTTAFTTNFKTNGISITAVELEDTQQPIKGFTGHPVGPSNAPSATGVVLNGGQSLWGGGAWQFKVAYLYRDGSVSMPSPASNTVVQQLILGQFLSGFNLTGIQTGPVIGTLDVVARFIYMGAGLLKNPNFSLTAPGAAGFPLGTNSSPEGFNDPTWGSNVTGIIIVPDNTTTDLSNFSHADYGYIDPNGAYLPGLLVGGFGANLPYDSGSILSVDPVPIWPNPDGPYLEDVDPPDDLTDDNPLTLHQDAGQSFTVTVDLSQVRNRVIVLGSGSLSSLTAKIGDTQVFVADISNFSPSGGRVRIEDAASFQRFEIGYVGVTGVPGRAAIQLRSALTVNLAQGSTVVNFFQADDFESQKLLAKAELDANGNETDGIHEYVISDGSLKAVFQLFMRAHAELEMYSRPIVQIRFASRDPKMKSGQMVHVDQTDPPCQGDFLIQEVTIDQIGDEAELSMLSPRYTVTATSSRFELNDLLLRIIGGQIGQSVSSAGIATAGTSAAQTLARGNLSAVTGQTSRAFTAAWIESTSTTMAQVPASCWQNTQGTFSSVIDTTSMWLRATAATALQQNQPGGANRCWLEHLPFFQVKFRTGPAAADVTGVEFWISWGATVSPQLNAQFQASGVGQKGLGFRYSSAAGDGGFRPFTHDATNGIAGQTMYPSLISVAPATIYVCTINVISATQAILDINGFSQTVAIPASALSTLMGGNIIMYAEDGVTTTKRLDFHSMYLERG